MLWYFLTYPQHYWIPVIANLIVLILCSRFLGHKYRGELKMMNNPVIILCASVLWPMFDAEVIAFVVGYLVGRVIGFLIGRNER